MYVQSTRICSTGYVIRICILIDFGHDIQRMDQDLSYIYDGQFFSQLTAPNLLQYIPFTNRALARVLQGDNR